MKKRREVSINEMLSCTMLMNPHRQERKEYDICTISSDFVKHLGVKATVANATRAGIKCESESGSRPRLVASEHEKVLQLYQAV